MSRGRPSGVTVKILGITVVALGFLRLSPSTVFAQGLGSAPAQAYSFKPMSPYIAPPPRRPPPPPPPSTSEPVLLPPPPSRGQEGLMDRFGSHAIDRLLRSNRSDDRVRGIERAASLGTEESLGLLSEAMEAGEMRTDGQAMLTLAMELGPRAGEPLARKLLGAIAFGSQTGRAKEAKRNATPQASERETELAPLARRVAVRALALNREGRVTLVDALRGEKGSQLPIDSILGASEGAMPKLFSADRAESEKTIELAARWNDLRSLPRLRVLADDTESPRLARAALRALAQMSDGKSRTRFLESLKSGENDTKIAGLDGLLAIHEPAAEKWLLELLGSDGTRAQALGRAAKIDSVSVVKALGKLLPNAENEEARKILGALSAQTSAEATRALTSWLGDKRFGGEVAFALGRSRAPLPDAELRKVAAIGKRERRLVFRALFLRGSRDGFSPLFEDIAEQLKVSKDVADRALSTFAAVASGRTPLTKALATRDGEERRLALQAGSTLDEERPAFLARFEREKEETERALLVAGLSVAARASLPTSFLEERERRGGLDREVVAEALASQRKVDDVVAMMAAPVDVALRSALGRGLAANRDPHALGFLADLYRAEVNDVPRRALLTSLLSRKEDSPRSAKLLDWARRYEPDETLRALANRAAVADENEIYWIEVKPFAPTDPRPQGIVLLPDGRARPFIVDADGFALLKGVPLSGSRIILTPLASFARGEK